MIDYLSTFTYTDLADFPNTLSINETVPGAADGTELVKAMIDDFWGFNQALMDKAGLRPDSVTEAPGTSQRIEAIQKAFALNAGRIVEYAWNATGIAEVRILPLHGQVILIASYPDLVANTYVGDGTNTAAHSAGGGYVKTSDAGGTTPNIAGTYFVLPDIRGYTGRVLDPSGTIDPQGDGRYLGDLQLDNFQGHKIQITDATYRNTGTFEGNLGFLPNNGSVVSSVQTRNFNSGIITDGTNGTPRTGSETRMLNYSTEKGITY